MRPGLDTITATWVPPTWVLVGSEGLWGAECLTPGCLWVTTGPTPETVDAAAGRHTETCCREGVYVHDDH